MSDTLQVKRENVEKEVLFFINKYKIFPYLTDEGRKIEAKNWANVFLYPSSTKADNSLWMPISTAPTDVGANIVVADHLSSCEVILCEESKNGHTKKGWKSIGFSACGDAYTSFITFKPTHWRHRECLPLPERTTNEPEGD